MTVPPRGFPPSEFKSRVAAAQTLMASDNLDALLLTTEPEIRYYTGFLTRFWESPTRPWFLVLPASGAPVAVIPEIGAHLMQQTWITDIRTWNAPDYSNDGIQLLADTLAELTSKTGRIGCADQLESHVRMPLASFRRLEALLSRPLVGDAGVTAKLRAIKSPRELEKIETAIQIGNRAFARVPEIAAAGIPLDQVFRAFQRLCLEEGADWVPYLAGAAGPDGYADVISPATETPLAPGDVLMLDTGVIWDGYFCDFDRNYSVGPPGLAAEGAYSKLLDGSAAAFDTAKPGVRISDLFHAMTRVLGEVTSGRLGHGLGMQLTEGPSIVPQDHTVLRPGMVLTLEPSISTSRGRLLVHEENIVIEETGARYLTTPAPHAMTVI